MRTLAEGTSLFRQEALGPDDDSRNIDFLATSVATCNQLADSVRGNRRYPRGVGIAFNTR